ncbi:MAG: S8 family serine peptidase [Alphaproteobacteria bacterium]|nr:S8 family serine peptidase [Alphaproteobacteria bacterium]
MRVTHKRSMAELSVATAIALAALAVMATASQAQRVGNFSAGPRAPISAPSLRSEPSTILRVEPRYQRFNNDADRVVVTGEPKAKGKRPDRNPVIGAGVVTGVAVGTAIGAGRPAGAGPTGPGSLPGGTAAQRNINIPPVGEERFVKDEVVLEFGNVPPGGIAQLLTRRGLLQLESQFFTLTNSTVVRARILNGRPVRTALRGLGPETILRFGQPNYLFDLAQAAADPARITPAVATAAAVPARGDPAQYALGKLRLGEAHTLATGERVLVAVIDFGIDADHPELAGAIAGSYDALGKGGPPHRHGTAIAGAIAAHARLMGAAPTARILAIRAFDSAGGSAQATTMAILKGVEYAVLQQARIINMSFAGASDPALARQLAVAKLKDIVLIAASGNFGPKSPPQYPSSDPNVIAVSATDADDRLFRASNIGPHIALAAPGVDILLPEPGNEYRLISGTSFSAAYVSGVAALVLQRAPGLKPDGVREVLQKTARDIGPAGKDSQFGAGLVDAYQAIMALQAPTAAADPTARR